MTGFTASNGIPVTLTTDGRLIVENADHTYPATIAAGEHIQSLREFFQHERDEELGRWRWPENPDYVVYPEDGGAHNVVRESTGLSLMASRDGIRSHKDPHADAARAYFEAHPERKPWEDATYKDVWTWTTADNTQEALGWVAGDGTWDIITPKGDGIKAAERPVSALVEAGFEKFRGEVSGVKRIPEDAS